eukprot:1158293-Pelagomonas_calceolata.AAC.4
MQQWKQPICCSVTLSGFKRVEKSRNKVVLLIPGKAEHKKGMRFLPCLERREIRAEPGYERTT